jgi:hypothetical protein
MPPLTGKEALEFHAQVAAKAEQKKAEQLASARADAAQRGKEPFDLAKLETLCDTSHEGRMAPVQERHAELERMYYVSYPDVMTLAEFARKVEVLNRW